MTGVAVHLEDLFAALTRAPHLTPGELSQPTGAIDRRRHDTVQRCAFCDERATTAVIAGPSDLIGRPRWLDMCWPHFGAVRSLPVEDDAEVVRTYQRWLTAQEGSQH